MDLLNPKGHKNTKKQNRHVASYLYFALLCTKCIIIRALQRRIFQHMDIRTRMNVKMTQTLNPLQESMLAK